MPSAFPDTATLRTALEVAARAPSAQNSQPWHWVVDSSGLHLDADWDRRLGDSHLDRADVLLGCGAVLDHCAVALAAAGWHPRIRRFPDGDRGGRLASFELIETQPAPGSVELAAAIGRRRSDRRRYGTSPLAPVTLELLLVRAARFGVQLAAVPKNHWIRLGDNGIALRYGQENGSAERSGDGVLLGLGTDADDDAARLRAGEAASRLLLSATAMGLASCPLTEPLRDPRERLSLACELYDGQAYPQILIRLGPPAGAADLAPAPRRPVAETTTWL